MNIRMLLPLLFVSAVAPALACSVFSTAAIFEPDPASLKKKNEYAFLLDVPAPKVVVPEVTRATASTVGSCKMYTWVNLEVSLPGGSEFDLSEVGFVFRLEPGAKRDVFGPPDVPVVDRNVARGSRVAHFRFGLVDPPSERSRPFKQRLEVFAINDGLQVGPSSFFFVSSPPAKPGK